MTTSPVLPPFRVEQSDREATAARKGREGERSNKKQHLDSALPLLPSLECHRWQMNGLGTGKGGEGGQGLRLNIILDVSG